MTSVNKKRKTDKRLHWGRGGNFLKDKSKMKGICFYNSAIRRELNRILNFEINYDD